MKHTRVPVKIWEKGLSHSVTRNRCLSPISSITNMSNKVSYNRNKNSILHCQIHCALKKIYLKATCCSEHKALPCVNPSPRVIIGDEAICQRARVCHVRACGCKRVLCLYVCVYLQCVCLGSDCISNCIFLLAPRAVVTLLTLWGCTGRGYTIKTHTHIRTHIRTHTLLSFPGSSTAGSNEEPIGGIQRTPHNCLTEKPKLLMGTTLIFPFFKGSLFLPHL